MKDLTLPEVTHKLLIDRPASLTLQDVAEKTGLTLSWIKDFHIHGDKREASAKKIITLYNFLSPKKLKF